MFQAALLARAEQTRIEDVMSDSNASMAGSNVTVDTFSCNYGQLSASDMFKEVQLRSAGMPDSQIAECAREIVSRNTSLGDDEIQVQAYSVQMSLGAIGLVELLFSTFGCFF